MYRTRGQAFPLALLGCTLVGFSSADAQAGDWTRFHSDRLLSGSVRDSVFKGSNAGGLAIQWQANTGGAVWSSPVVKYFSKMKKSVVFVGSSSKIFGAYDAATGDRLWYFKTGANILSTPVIWGNSVWIGSQDRFLRKLDAATGALQCEYISDGGITSAPVIVDPDGSGPAGPWIFFGDAGLAGADDGGHVTAVDTADCKEKWRFSGYGEPGQPPEYGEKAGTWSPISFVPAWGTHPPLILFGGSSPDNGVYAVNAITGNADTNVPLWRVQAAPHINDLDVGTGVTVSTPTTAQPGGVGYVTAKNSIWRALDLNDGKQLWEFDVSLDSPGTHGVRSTAALAQGVLFFGYEHGLYALNARTGTKRWKTPDLGLTTPDVLSSPAVSFPSDLGSSIADAAIFFGDLGGTVRALNGLGQQVWSYQTGGPVFASPALTQDRMFVGSSDGFLYAFGIGGGVSAKPETVVTSPLADATVPNPGVGAEITISGSATDDVALSRVLIAVKNTSTGGWWDPVNKVWAPIFTQFAATLDSPGSRASTWQATFPVASIAGGDMYVQAEAVDSDGQHDAEVAQVPFKVPTLGNPPTGAFTYPLAGKSVISRFPDGRASYMITLTGTAEDTQGKKPGIRRVYIEVRNSDHGEDYCGAAGCAGLPEGTLWRPSFVQLDAVVANPGATSTTWSLQFPTYDHPHNYRFRIRPVDLDGEAATSWIDGGKICVRDPGPVQDCYGGK